MRRPYLRLTLQTRMVGLLALGAALPALLLGIPLLRRSETALVDRVRETPGREANRAGGELDQWTAERVREVSRWASSVSLLENVESLRGWGSDPVRARREVESALQSILARHPVYESLFIVDPRGAFLASTRPESWEDWERRLVKGGGIRHDTVVSPLHRSAALGRPTALVVHRLLSRDDDTMAYFVGRLAVGDLVRRLGAVGPVSLWLLDEDGQALVQEGRLLADRGDVFPDRPRPAADGLASTGEGRLPGLGRALYAVQPLRGPMPGFVAATVPVDAAYGSLWPARLGRVTAGLLLVAAVVAAVALLVRRVLRPLARLSEAARRVSAGELEVEVAARGDDDLSELTRAFNQMAADLRERRAAEQALAGTDRLTGLPNHRHFEECLDKEVRRAEREGRALSLLMLELDPSPSALGERAVGEADLPRVAVEVVQTVRSTDVAFRYGREVLSVLLHTCGKGEALPVAEKIRRAVALSAAAAPDAPPATTVSIGVATFPDDGSVSRALVDAALGALQLARSDGRNCVVAARNASAPARYRGESLVHLRPAAPPAAPAVAASLPRPAEIDARVVVSS
jgi:diguanylate cyclase (GGDEF)-like protein